MGATLLCAARRPASGGRSTLNPSGAGESAGRGRNEAENVRLAPLATGSRIVAQSVGPLGAL